MKLFPDIYNIKHNNEKLEVGKILISQPYFDDSYFNKSIVLIISTDNKSYTGFILNKFIDYSINDLISNFPPFDGKLTTGGPVEEDRLHYIHKYGNIIPNSIHLFDDIYMSGNFETIKDLIQQNILKPDKIRFFIGYSGWSPGQLQTEIKQNSWLVATIDNDKIFCQEKNIWADIIDSLDGDYKALKNIPNSPSLN